MLLPKPVFLLVQNPPSIPTLFVAWTVCKIRRICFVIDWHNFGHSILALSIRNRVIITLAKWYENYFGEMANAHFCVSNSMRIELQKNWRIFGANVLHDSPPEFFRRATPEEKIDFFRGKKSLFKSVNLNLAKFVVTATSFTKDEKLEMLLESIELLEKKINLEEKNWNFSFPEIIFVVTGKGDGRKKFEIAANDLNLNLKKCQIVVTYFDSFSDYAKFLGSADLGLSFHFSSSGFDLPMKIVDMFGAKLPVFSVNYNCISELVAQEKNGKIFENAAQLSQQLWQVFAEKKGEKKGEKNNFVSELERLRNGVEMRTWDASWNDVCWPVIKNL